MEKNKKPEIVEAVLHNRLHVPGCGDLGTTLTTLPNNLYKKVGLEFVTVGDSEFVRVSTQDANKKNVEVLIPITNFLFIKSKLG